MKQTLSLLIGVVLLAGCNPAGSNVLNDSMIQLHSGAGDNATVQIVTVAGHRFAVVQACSGNGVAICEVTEASLVNTNAGVVH